jgi:hypothetical protein
MRGDKMTARQNHGFLNETRVKSAYNLLPYIDESPTAKYDAKSPAGIPISIKTARVGNEICLGDYRRNAETKNGFYLIISLWEGVKSNIVREIHLYIPGIIWNSFFDKKAGNKAKELIENASNDSTYTPIWKSEIEELKAMNTSRYIRFRPKRDSKRQRRMQCAISYSDILILERLYGTKTLKGLL